MSFKVRIDIGKGKNRAVSESTPLLYKKDVVRWIKQNPLGNANTLVSIKDLKTNKIISGRRLKFSSCKRIVI